MSESKQNPIKNTSDEPETNPESEYVFLEESDAQRVGVGPGGSDNSELCGGPGGPVFSGGPGGPDVGAVNADSDSCDCAHAAEGVKNVSEFEKCVIALRGAFRKQFNKHKGELYIVSPTGLNKAYLLNLPATMRQRANCSTCFRFMRACGNVVYFDENMQLVSAFWDHTVVPDDYKPAVKALEQLVASRPVIGLFYTAEQGNLGTVTSGGFSHFRIERGDIPRERSGDEVESKSGQFVRVHNGVISYAFEVSEAKLSQLSAAHLEDVRLLKKFLANPAYTTSLLNKAADMLSDDRFKNASKHLAMAEWAADTLEVFRSLSASGTSRMNWLHKVAATAPLGYCRASSTVYGTLLGNLIAKRDLTATIKQFNAFTAKDVYQRPTTSSVSVGAINEAEKVFEDLKLADSIKRRHASSAEIREHYKWSNPAIKRGVDAGGGPGAGGSGGSLFGHLKPKESSSINASAASFIPVSRMTWRTFLEDVLPLAKDMELELAQSMPFVEIIAPVHKDASPILRWDEEKGQRNPFSWTHTDNKDSPALYGLHRSTTTKVRVAGVGSSPVAWYGAKSFTELQFPLLFLEGLKSTRKSTLGLYPEFLREELRDVRKVVSLFSESHHLQDYDDRKQEDHAVAVKVFDNMSLLVQTARGKRRIVITGLK